MRSKDCSDVGEICWWKKVCWWRIFCMLVKLYVGEDRNLYVCWWSMLAKSFLYVGEKSCMLVKNLNRKLNVCWWSMLVKNFVYVGEHFEQKFKSMLVKYVGGKFYVCWWKERSWNNISFHQHAFSPTSFTNIRTAIKITYTSYELHQKNTSKFFFPTKIGVVYDLWGINKTIVVNYTILAIILTKWHVIGSIW